MGLNSNKDISILVLEDEPEILKIIKETLSLQKYRIVTAGDGLEGERKFKNEKFDLIITDISMPKVDGVTFIKRVRESEISRSTPVMVMSGYFDDFKPKLALFDNVHFLEKPFDVAGLPKIVQSIIEPPKNTDAFKNLITLSAGEVLLREGESGSIMYWVVEGTLEVSRNQEGKDVVLGTINQHELVGEMSFLDDKPRSATVTAAEECRLLPIPNGKFSEVLNSQPRWFKSLVKVLSDRLRATNLKVDI